MTRCWLNHPLASTAASALCMRDATVAFPPRAHSGSPLNPHAAFRRHRGVGVRGAAVGRRSRRGRGWRGRGDDDDARNAAEDGGALPPVAVLRGRRPRVAVDERDRERGAATTQQKTSPFAVGDAPPSAERRAMIA